MSSCELNRFFAKRMLKEAYSEEAAQFLEALMQKMREKDLCWAPATAPLLPPSLVEEGSESIPTRPIVHSQGRYYLQRNWVCETLLVKHALRLHAIQYPAIEIPPFPLLESQRRAIQASLARGFSIICGGPGTGKTYTASYLVRTLAAFSPQSKVIVAAPTGRAADHLKKILQAHHLQVEAMTIHRLLNLAPGETRVFENRKIDADLVLVDEASMLDVFLLASLFDAIGERTRLVLMGDPDQLPPVEASSLFAEMAPMFGTVLSQSMRTDNAGLLHLAQGIREGVFYDPPLDWSFDQTLFPKIYQRANPLFFDEEPDPQACLEQLQRSRILGALRQGPYGTDAFNQYILSQIDRHLRPHQWWVIPILITKNEPRQDLYNGSLGVLIGKSQRGLQLQESTAYFPAKAAFRDLPPFEPAFCLSIHKSQGGEFDQVLALFPPGSEQFGKEALYTAVTRAKKKVEIVAAQETVSLMLKARCKVFSGFTARLSKKDLTS